MKAEIRSVAIHDVGVRLDDLLEASRLEIAKSDGRVSAFVEAAKLPGKFVETVRAQIEKGEADLETSQRVMDAMTKMAAQLESMAKGAQLEKVQATGRMAGLRSAVEAAKTMHDAEKSKVAQVEAIVAGENARPAGAEPPSLKARRLADAKTRELMAQTVSEPASSKTRKKRKTRDD